MKKIIFVVVSVVSTLAVVIGGHYLFLSTGGIIQEKFGNVGSMTYWGIIVLVMFFIYGILSPIISTYLRK